VDVLTGPHALIHILSVIPEAVSIPLFDSGFIQAR